jgi:hypothetical protein
MELDEERALRASQENNKSEDEKALVKKVKTLEQNLQQLKEMYETVVKQKSGLNVDIRVNPQILANLQINEKKIERKNDRIVNLEQQLNETKDLVILFRFCLNF